MEAEKLGKGITSNPGKELNQNGSNGNEKEK